MNLRQKENIGVHEVFEKGPDIMSAPAGENAAQLIAHELGHVQRKPGFCDFKKQNPMVELMPPELCGDGSAFRLWHTFSTESDFFMPRKTSDNLMDYNDGERLHKYQWDYIHNPEGGLYLFQDEEEAAWRNVKGKIRSIVELSRFGYAF